MGPCNGSLYSQYNWTVKSPIYPKQPGANFFNAQRRTSAVPRGKRPCHCSGATILSSFYPCWNFNKKVTAVFWSQNCSKVQFPWKEFITPHINPFHSVEEIWRGFFLRNFTSLHMPLCVLSPQPFGRRRVWDSQHLPGCSLHACLHLRVYWWILLIFESWPACDVFILLRYPHISEYICRALQSFQRTDIDIPHRRCLVQVLLHLASFFVVSSRH